LSQLPKQPGSSLRDLHALFSGNKERTLLCEQIERNRLLLQQARSLNDLRSPYGNRLEALVGDRKGQHSIRVNDQWRICFRWQGQDAFDVEIVDYH